MSALTDQMATDFAANELNTDEFAVAATFDGGPGTINVLFNENAEVEDITTPGLVSLMPVALCQTSDVPAPEGKTLVIGSTTYYVTSSRTSSEGGTTRLILSEDEVDLG